MLDISLSIFIKKKINRLVSNPLIQFYSENFIDYANQEDDFENYWAQLR